MPYRRVTILALGGLLLTTPGSAQLIVPDSGSPNDTVHAASEAPPRSLPADPSVLATLARIEIRRGNDRAAAGYFQAALAFGGLSSQDATRFAWLLASSSDPSVRDPGVALQIAGDEIEAHPTSTNSQLIATMAVAYASLGNVEAAEEWRAKVLATPDAVRRPEVVIAVNEMVDRILAGGVRNTRAFAIADIR